MVYNVLLVLLGGYACGFLAHSYFKEKSYWRGALWLLALGVVIYLGAFEVV